MLAGRLRAEILLGFLLALAPGCERGPQPGPGERWITLPNGRRLIAEVLVRPEDMARGMMFRDPLPSNRALLFLHAQPGRYPYWMYNVKAPLDIIWMDASGRVVEISAHTPPCPSLAPEDCRSYGGTEVAAAVLEIRAGLAAESGIRLGVQLEY